MAIILCDSEHFDLLWEFLGQFFIDSAAFSCSNPTSVKIYSSSSNARIR